MESIGTPALWTGFIVFVLVMLALDLGVFHRKAHVVGFREAGTWSGVLALFALAFSGGLWAGFGPDAGMEFLSGYLIELTLSIDNLFVFVVVFSALRIPAIHQHRVLYWGIISALVLRAAMIFAGTAALQRFHWLVYVFGGFLVLTGLKLLFSRPGSHSEFSSGDNLALRLLRRIVPTTDRLHGSNFFTVEAGRRVATPLLVALVLVEITDVVFALDSIPAIFAVTMDPFIVFTSNIFAILGLRSLFFLLSGMIDRFRFLKFGLAGVLMFVGAKLALVDFVHVPPGLSLAIIGLLLGSAIAASILVPPPVVAPSQVPAQPEQA